MAIGKINVGSSKEALIEFDNYTSSNLTDDGKMILEVPIGSKYKFTEHDEEQISTRPSILVDSPATGYIKYKSSIIVTEKKPNTSILFAATEGENILHLREQEDGFDCTIDWGDGTNTVVPTDGGNIIHSYATAGDYNIQISGKSFAGFYVDYQDGSEKYKALYSMGYWENDTMTDMSSAFNGCINLTTISADLFRYNILITDMNKIFRKCENLTTIPVDLFKYNTLVTNMSSAFSGCINLTTIPADLFRYNILITDMNDIFGNCENLTTISTDLFKYNTLVTNMAGAFADCTSLTEIPKDLFMYNTLVTNMSWCFYGCTKLTTIPEDLFRYNILINNMDHTFAGCSSLTTLPADLLKYNTEIVNMYGTFADCIQLTLRGDIFGEDYDTRFNGKTVDFSDCFYRSTFNGVIGTAPALWDFIGLTYTKTKCFGGDGNSYYSLSNYADISYLLK